MVSIGPFINGLEINGGGSMVCRTDAGALCRQIMTGPPDSTTDQSAQHHARHVAISVDELSPLLQDEGKLMGLDLGTKTIGIAVSDVLRKIATPRETIKRTKFTVDVQRLRDIVSKEGICAIVVGLPVNMDGTEGRRVQSTRAFVRNLAAETPLPIALWDERLSTAAVQRMLLDADRSRARRAQLVDKLAAAYILQGALDRLSTL